MKKQRLMSLLLAAAMAVPAALQSVGTTAFADDTDTDQSAFTNDTVENVTLPTSPPAATSAVGIFKKTSFDPKTPSTWNWIAADFDNDGKVTEDDYRMASYQANYDINNDGITNEKDYAALYELLHTMYYFHFDIFHDSDSEYYTNSFKAIMTYMDEHAKNLLNSDSNSFAPKCTKKVFKETGEYHFESDMPIEYIMLNMQNKGYKVYYINGNGEQYECTPDFQGMVFDSNGITDLLIQPDTKKKKNNKNNKNDKDNKSYCNVSVRRCGNLFYSSDLDLSGTFETSPVAESNEPATEIKKGDINDDGSVNLKDVVLLRRYIAGGWDAEIDTNVADVNGDGAINLKDVVLLRRYIADGWDVELK